MSEENNNASNQQEDTKPYFAMPSLFLDKESAELFRELTVILTRQWRKDGKFVYGASENDLLLATLLDISSLTDLLKEYAAIVNELGLELVDYTLQDQKWYCLKSSFYAPPELSAVQLLILGTVIGLIETTGKGVKTKDVKSELATQGILKEYQVENGLRELEVLGYIHRIKNIWHYNYRTLIEFDDETRKAIAERHGKL